MVDDPKEDLSIGDRILQVLFTFPVVMSILLLLWWGTFWIAKTMMQWFREF